MEEIKPLDLQSGGQQVPNATAVLVLGICSIVLCFCYGIVGLICGIIALVLAKKGMEEYNTDPGRYQLGSLKNLKAGKICAIVGLCLSGLYFLFILIALMTVGSEAFTNPNVWQHYQY